MRFRNPLNGYTEDSNHCWLWSLLFGPFYFAYKGAWFHFFLGVFLACVTFVSWVVYPFFAESVVRTVYQRKGWGEITTVPLL